MIAKKLKVVKLAAKQRHQAKWRRCQQGQLPVEVDTIKDEEEKKQDKVCAKLDNLR